MRHILPKSYERKYEVNHVSNNASTDKTRYCLVSAYSIWCFEMPFRNEMWIYRYLSITLTTTWTRFSSNVNGGIFGVVTHSGLFRGHPSPGTKIRNDTFGTYFLVQQLTTNQWHIIWLYLSIVRLIPCTENLFVAFVLHGNIKTTGLLRSGFSLGDLRYASSLLRKVHGRWGPWGCQRARVKIVSRNCIDFA